MIRAVRIGEEFPDVAHLGGLLPVGSRVSSDRHSSYQYTHRAPRTWVNGHGALMDVAATHAPMMLDDAGGLSVIDLPEETLSQFRWRLRDAALAAADRSNVQRGPVREMVTSFGADKPLLTVGGVVSNSIDIPALPPGSVVYAGHPSTPDLMTVWTMSEQGNLRHTFGPMAERMAGQPLTIYSLPGAEAEPLVSEPVADAPTLAKAALRAWRIGRVYQQKNSWCSVFDITLTMLGINDKTVAIAGEAVRGPGEMLDRDQVALMPEGTLLWWSWQRRSAFAVYVRDDRARNKARTRRVFGWQDDLGNSHEQMQVVQTPTEPMVWRMSGTYLAQMPDGVQYRDQVNQLITLGPHNRHWVEHYRRYDIERWIE